MHKEDTCGWVHVAIRVHLRENSVHWKQRGKTRNRKTNERGSQQLPLCCGEGLPRGEPLGKPQQRAQYPFITGYFRGMGSGLSTEKLFPCGFTAFFKYNISKIGHILYFKLLPNNKGIWLTFT